MSAINRRELLSGAVGLAGLPLATVNRERPWTKRAAELAEQEGVYADYCAWKEWFAIKAADRGYADLGPESEVERTALYSIMCELAGGREERSGG